MATGLVTDPWVDGQPRFARAPLRLPARAGAGAGRGGRAAWRPPSTRRPCRSRWPSRPLLDDFFALTPVQKLLWAELGAAVARDGPRRRVPGRGAGGAPADGVRAERRHPQRPARGGAAGPGHRRAGRARSQPRAGGPLRRAAGALPRGASTAPAPPAPSRWASSTRPRSPATSAWSACTSAGARRAAGRWCWARPSTCGRRRAGGSPCSARPCDLLIRHYKTDWWGERLPIWADEDPYPDPEPLARPAVRLLLRGHRRRPLRGGEPVRRRCWPRTSG